MNLKQWNEYKLWLAPLTAVALWLISVTCFVFGLSFKNPIMVSGYDLTLIISFAIALCNTFIQLIGNDNYEKDESGVFVWIWIASYVLGISSNTNSLLKMLGIDNVVLEWAVALPLGAIIEIAPEKLIMIWLKSYKKPENRKQMPSYNPQFQPTYKPVTPSMSPKQPMIHKVSGTDRRKELEGQRQKHNRNESETPLWAKGGE